MWSYKVLLAYLYENARSSSKRLLRKGGCFAYDTEKQ